MGTIKITQLESVNELTENLQSIHLDLLEGIENKYKVEMSRNFWSKMSGPNLAYLNFEGSIDDVYNNTILLAHSGINKYKENEPITEFLNEVYTVAQSNSIFPNYYVDRENKISVKEISFLKNSLQENIWNREVDSESKVIEEFIINLKVKRVKTIRGNLLLYTYYYPCLSCSNKLLKVLDMLSTTYPELNIDIVYVIAYGNS